MKIAMSVMMLTGNFIFMRYFGDAGVAAYSIACYLFPLLPSLFPAWGMWAAIPASELCTFLIILACRLMKR